MVSRPTVKIGWRVLAWLLIAGLLILFINVDETVSAAGPDKVTTVFNFNHHEDGIIEVKFKDGLKVRLRNGLPTDLDQQTLRSSQATTAFNAVSTGHWSLTHYIGEAAIDQLQTQVKQRSTVTLPDLHLFYRLALPPTITVPEALKLFSQLDEVETVGPVPKAFVATPPNYQNSESIGTTYQRYLDPAPNGINARYAWQATNGVAAGIKICDVEYGWNDDHADLPSVPQVTAAPANDIQADWLEHGTAVLGVMGGLQNGWGVTGIAHDATFRFAAVKTGQFSNIAGAITACANDLNPGDVIIIEQQIAGPNRPANPAIGDQTGLVPVEWNLPIYTAIQTAVATGIVVVEAAGNGAQNLDSAAYNTGNGNHFPFSTGKDSGAIIVGAGAPPNGSGLLPRARLSFSNYGTTVDLQGWGALVAAPGYGDLYDDEGGNLNYTRFSGTSSASPIVAASAAIIQRNYKQKNGTPVSPAQIRALLRNTGTPQQGSANIGPLPNLKAAIEAIWSFTPPGAPVITPSSGTYTMPLQATISYAVGQVGSPTIRYTLNGSEPTEDSFIFIPEQGDTLYLNYGLTLKAKVFEYNAAAGRRFESETTSVTYVSSTPKVATPQISPSGGVYNQPHQVVITTDTPDATIRYRTDGRTVSFFYPGVLYTGPITLDPGTYEISARAFKDGYYKSDNARSGDITVNALTLPSPIIYPNGSTFAGSVTVYLGSTVLGADIRYTLDGSDPTPSSLAFTETIYLTESTTVKARIYLDGYTPSPIVSSTFEVIAIASPPTITPNGGTANDSVQVSLSTTTPNSIIRYTTNGAEPTSYSSLYSGPFTLGVGQHTVKAKTYLAGAISSNTTSAEFAIYDTLTAIDPPVVYPPGGNYNGPITVTISSNIENVFLSYTDDGSDPDMSATLKPYNGPFRLYGNADYIIRARAFDLDTNQSAKANIVTLVVVTPTNGIVMTPTFSIPGGQYTNTVQLSIVAPDHLAPNRIRQLYIKTDGTEPEVIFLQGEGNTKNLSISKPQTVKAIATQVGWLNSPTITAEYTFKCDAPTITPASSTYTETVMVSMSTGTMGVPTLTYSIDGSEPTESSPEYTAPFTLTVGTHTVKAECFRNDYEASDTVSHVFIVNPMPVAPSFSLQPQSQTVSAGTTITFTTIVTGIPYPNLQWQRNGIDIAGEVEPDLVIAATSLADVGDYALVAANQAGIITSTTATLTVVEPALTIGKVGPSSANLSEPIIYTLMVTNSGTAPAQNLVITDVVPTGAAYQAGGMLTDGVVSWLVSDLAPQATTSVTFTVTATQSVVNHVYGVVADGGYYATGQVAVPTTVGVILPATGGTVSPAPGVTVMTGADAFTDTVILHYTPRGQSATDPLGDVDRFYELTATYLDGSPAQLQPGATYSIVVSYEQIHVDADLQEATLALYYWNGSMWVKAPSSVVDTGINRVTAMVNQLGLWAVLGEREQPGEETVPIYLPIVLK